MWTTLAATSAFNADLSALAFRIHADSDTAPVPLHGLCESADYPHPGLFRESGNFVEAGGQRPGFQRHGVHRGGWRQRGDELGFTREKLAGVVLELRNDPAADTRGVIRFHGFILGQSPTDFVAQSPCRKGSTVPSNGLR